MARLRDQERENFILAVDLNATEDLSSGLVTTISGLSPLTSPDGEMRTVIGCSNETDGARAGSAVLLRQQL